MARRRSATTLYSRPACVHSHRVRLVMAEKGVTRYQVVELRADQESEDLLQLNPYNTVPTLVDRELVVYDPRIIVEYIDERYPHPSLMPVDPGMRAQYRLAIFRMETDLYPLFDELDEGGRPARRAAARVSDMLTTLAADFSTRPYVGDEYSLVDCTLAPVLWRLEHYRIKLPEKHGDRLRDYAKRLFERPAFVQSLSAAESEMRSADIG